MNLLLPAQNFFRGATSAKNRIPRKVLHCCVWIGVLAGLNASVFADDSVQKLPQYTVTQSRPDTGFIQMPQVTQSVTAGQMNETINLVDTEDAVKYFPSIFIRKRNYGDTQPVMATRVWGVSSSARSLVYADGVLLTALVANNNTIGAPRWGLVAPAEIERIDVLYGPFSAAYPGNSMGAVMEITTRMPEKLEASLGQTLAWQFFRQYATKNTFAMKQTSATLGDRVGGFSFWVSANYQDSHSQPLSYVTNATFPAGTTGGFLAFNKTGQPASVFGASGLLHTRMTDATFKAAYDFTPALRATYTLGLWRNDADSHVQTYLRDSAGRPTFAGLSGFASGYYQLLEEHTMQSLSLKSNTQGDWDWEAIATLYSMNKDTQKTPGSASATGTSFSQAGKVALLGGTGWSTLDLKGIWCPGGKTGEHEVSFGAHDDLYKLVNPTYNTPDWQSGRTFTSIATEGNGKTETEALWAQDVWHFAPAFKATVGGRYEWWRAFDGLNINGAAVVHQPEVRYSNFSPKATLAWTVAPKWQVTASVGKAYRYATASELYQLVSTGVTFTSPNPNLKPDDDLSTELRIERTLDHGYARLSLFQDDIYNAIISQFNPLVPGSPTLFQFNSNIDHVRARGIETVLDYDNAFVPGLELSGSATYLDAKVLADQGRGQFGSAVGKTLPNIPDWRMTFVATYRIGRKWSFTAAGRYSGKLYTTLDNNDVNPNTYQGFSAFFVADARVHCQIDRHWAASLGMDNILNRKYFFFHPFPQRTVIADLKYDF